jgi:hypothetical protein
MAQETLKLVITADTKEALDNLQNFIKASKGLKGEMQNFGKVGNQATQALSNLSRVAQDAPYGFMGIANNINPLLESFQRLQKESGGSTQALKAMAAGLTGPAGIGLAIGVATSLIVAFGDEIGDFFNKVTGGSQSLKEYNNAFSQTKKEFANAYVEVENVNNAFERFRNGTLSKKDALDQYNNSLGKVYGTTKDIAEAEKVFINNKESYVKAALFRAAAQIALQKAAEQAFKQLEAQNAPQNVNKGSLFMGEGLGAFALSKLTGGPAITGTDILGAEAIGSKAKTLEEVFKGIAKQFNEAANEQDKYATRTKNFNTEITKTTDTFSSNLRKENNAILEAIRLRKELGKTAQYITGQTAQDKANAERKRKADIAAFGKQQMTGELGDYLQGKTSVFYEQQKKINEQKALDIQITKEQTDANIQLADTLSNYAANAFMNLFSAMQQGQSIGEALKNVFIGIAEQIAFAAIKAAAFTAILNMIPGMQGVSESLGGFKGVFKRFLGLADGGIVTKPTFAMVGEGNESEAVMPLSKLGNLMNNTFNAGAMASNGGGGNGEFILRGTDLVLAMNRSETSLKYRRG